MAGRTYQFDLQGAPSGQGTIADTFLRRIRDADGVKSLGDGRHRTYNDDFEGSGESRVTFTATESGTYYVEVSGDRDETGTYTLTVADVTPTPTPPLILPLFGTSVQLEDPPLIASEQQAFSPPADTRDIDVGERMVEYLERRPILDHSRNVLLVDPDVQWFKVELTAGIRYWFEAAPWGRYVRLELPLIQTIYDTNGNPISVTPDFYDTSGDRVLSHRALNGAYYTAADEGELTAVVEFIPQVTGTHYVGVGGRSIGPVAKYQGYHFGSFSLSVTQADDYGETAGGAGQIEVGGYTTGEVQKSSRDVTWRDVDWFAVELTGGTQYRIDVKGEDTNSGTLPNPHLRGVYDSGGNLLSGTTDDDSGFGNNSRVLFTPLSTGTYYVAAGGFRRDTGTYRVEVTAVTSDDYAADNTTGRVSVGGSTTGQIETANDVDWFQVPNLVNGREYRFDLEGEPTEAGTLADPHLAGIYRVVFTTPLSDTEDADSGEGRNSRLDYIIGRDDVAHYVGVRGATAEARGTYRLSVTEIDDYTAATITRGTVTVGGSARGRIHNADDEDPVLADGGDAIPDRPQGHPRRRRHPVRSLPRRHLQLGGLQDPRHREERRRRHLQQPARLHPGYHGHLLYRGRRRRLPHRHLRRRGGRDDVSGGL